MSEDNNEFMSEDINVNLELSSKFKIVNYERELIHFNLCELNVGLVLVRCELALA